jgi:hypothetical protein
MALMGWRKFLFTRLWLLETKRADRTQCSGVSDLRRAPSISAHSVLAFHFSHSGSLCGNLETLA